MGGLRRLASVADFASVAAASEDDAAAATNAIGGAGLLSRLPRLLRLREVAWAMDGTGNAGGNQRSRRRREYRRVDPHLAPVVLPILGLDGAGKSTALSRLKRDSRPTPGPSWGFAVHTAPVRRAWWQWHAAPVTFYDVGGSDKIRGIWPNYFAESHGCIFVVDSAAPERFDEAAEALRGMYCDRRMAGKPLVILANKQDAPCAVSNLTDLSTRLGVAQLVAAGKDAFLREHGGAAITVGDLILVQRCVARGRSPFDVAAYRYSVLQAVRWILAKIQAKVTTLAPRVAEETLRQREEWEREKEARRKRVEGYLAEEAAASQAAAAAGAGASSRAGSSGGGASAGSSTAPAREMRPNPPQRSAPPPPPPTMPSASSHVLVSQAASRKSAPQSRSASRRRSDAASVQSSRQASNPTASASLLAASNDDAKSRSSRQSQNDLAPSVHSAGAHMGGSRQPSPSPSALLDGSQELRGGETDVAVAVAVLDWPQPPSAPPGDSQNATDQARRGDDFETIETAEEVPKPSEPVQPMPSTRRPRPKTARRGGVRSGGTSTTAVAAPLASGGPSALVEAAGRMLGQALGEAVTHTHTPPEISDASIPARGVAESTAVQDVAVVTGTAGIGRSEHGLVEDVTAALGVSGGQGQAGSAGNVGGDALARASAEMPRLSAPLMPLASEARAQRGLDAALPPLRLLVGAAKLGSRLPPLGASAVAAAVASGVRAVAMGGGGGGLDGGGVPPPPPPPPGMLRLRATRSLTCSPRQLLLLAGRARSRAENVRAPVAGTAGAAARWPGAALQTSTVTSFTASAWNHAHTRMALARCMSTAPSERAVPPPASESHPPAPTPTGATAAAPPSTDAVVRGPASAVQATALPATPHSAALNSLSQILDTAAANGTDVDATAFEVQIVELVSSRPRPAAGYGPFLKDLRGLLARVYPLPTPPWTPRSLAAVAGALAAEARAAARLADKNAQKVATQPRERTDASPAGAEGAPTPTRQFGTLMRRLQTEADSKRGYLGRLRDACAAEALRLMGASMSLPARSTTALASFVQACAAGGKGKAAVTDVLLTRVPLDENLVASMIYAYGMLGEIESAESTFESYRASDLPSSPEPYKEMVGAYMRCNHVDKALGVISSVLPADQLPLEAEYFEVLLQSLYGLSKPDLVFQWYDYLKAANSPNLPKVTPAMSEVAFSAAVDAQNLALAKSLFPTFQTANDSSAICAYAVFAANQMEVSEKDRADVVTAALQRLHNNASSIHGALPVIVDALQVTKANRYHDALEITKQLYECGVADNAVERYARQTIMSHAPDVSAMLKVYHYWVKAGIRTPMTSVKSELGLAYLKYGIGEAGKELILTVDDFDAILECCQYVPVRRGATNSATVPGVAAARRYARVLGEMEARGLKPTLVQCHKVAAHLRSLNNHQAVSDWYARMRELGVLTGPKLAGEAFDPRELSRASAEIREAARSGDLQRAAQVYRNEFTGPGRVPHADAVMLWLDALVAAGRLEEADQLERDIDANRDKLRDPAFHQLSAKLGRARGHIRAGQFAAASEVLTTLLAPRPRAGLTREHLALLARLAARRVDQISGAESAAAAPAADEVDAMAMTLFRGAEAVESLDAAQQWEWRDLLFLLSVAGRHAEAIELYRRGGAVAGSPPQPLYAGRAELFVRGVAAHADLPTILSVLDDVLDREGASSPAVAAAAAAVVIDACLDRFADVRAALLVHDYAARRGLARPEPRRRLADALATAAAAATAAGDLPAATRAAARGVERGLAVPRPTLLDLARKAAAAVSNGADGGDAGKQAVVAAEAFRLLAAVHAAGGGAGVADEPALEPPVPEDLLLPLADVAVTLFGADDPAAARDCLLLLHTHGGPDAAKRAALESALARCAPRAASASELALLVDAVPGGAELAAAAADADADAEELTAARERFAD
ncbi:ADP-ribosylation factor-like protein 13B, partial [Cladochytrium tenue]